ncbi:MAG: hypothetical protein EA375_00810 [Acholeplasmataceae bacterium]|nr:MAG: hypothetical protein EA375_00810 [Acholeplasmataceae bacterium]
MKDAHKIGLIAIGYAVILTLATLIFYPDYMAWAVLGAATALFNHSQMIHITKGKYSTERLLLHLFQRYILYIIIIAVAWFSTREQETIIMTQTFVFLLLGFISVKVGAIIFATPLFKKNETPEEEAQTDDAASD